VKRQYGGENIDFLSIVVELITSYNWDETGLKTFNIDDLMSGVENAMQKKLIPRKLTNSQRAFINHAVSVVKQDPSNWLTLDREEIEINRCGLQVEEKLAANSNYASIMNALPDYSNQMAPGAYKLQFPVCLPLFGTEISYHTVGFVVDNNGDALLYDANTAIGIIKADKLKTSIDKLMSFYNA